MSADPKICIERSATVTYTKLKQNTHNFEQLSERVLTQRSLPNNQLQLLQGHCNNNNRQDWFLNLNAQLTVTEGHQLQTS